MQMMHSSSSSSSTRELAEADALMLPDSDCGQGEGRQHVRRHRREHSWQGAALPCRALAEGFAAQWGSAGRSPPPLHLHRHPRPQWLGTGLHCRRRARQVLMPGTQNHLHHACTLCSGAHLGPMGKCLRHRRGLPFDGRGGAAGGRLGRPVGRPLRDGGLLSPQPSVVLWSAIWGGRPCRWCHGRGHKAGRGHNAGRQCIAGRRCKARRSQAWSQRAPGKRGQRGALGKKAPGQLGKQ